MQKIVNSSTGPVGSFTRTRKLSNLATGNCCLCSNCLAIPTYYYFSTFNHLGAKSADNVANKPQQFSGSEDYYLRQNALLIQHPMI